MKRQVMIGMLVASCLGQAGAAGAQTAEYQALLQEIRGLRERVAELEEVKARLDQLEQQLAVAEAEPRPEEEVVGELDTEEGIRFGGALRFNYSYKEWDSGSQDRGGDFDLDTIRLNVDGALSKVLLSAEYRFYGDGTEGIIGIDDQTAELLGGAENYNFLHHGWFGYDFSANLQGQLGVTQVPFGILPYASHNWFFQLPYYVGLEDDYDAGVKFIWAGAPWNLQAAFFKSSEYADSNSERYSYDVVSDLGHSNEETNQGNLRATYAIPHGEWGSTEIGLSGQLGQLYNSTTDEHGTHWAGALHLNGVYGPWNLQLEFIRYELEPENPPGVDDRVTVMGAYDFPYRIASEADLWVAGLSYTLPVSWGPIEELIFYNDYSLMDKAEGAFKNSQMNVTGVAIAGGPIFSYVDWAMGKNHPWLGPGWLDSLAAGDPEDEWFTRFNVNFGYYF